MMVKSGAHLAAAWHQYTPLLHGVIEASVHFGPGAAYRRRGATLYGLFDIGGARPVVLGCPSTHM
eukprot:scaffold44985_cov68-Phaeocystis_antarctica.AAC.9